MATKVPIPNLSESISQVTLLRWIKNEGDYVHRDDPLAELETDKANTELPAPVSGVLHQARKVGDVLKIGDLAATIDETAAAPAAAGAKPAAARYREPHCTRDRTKQQTAQEQLRTAQPAQPAPATAGTAAASPAPAEPSAPPGPSPAELEDVNPSVRPLLVEHKLSPKDIPATGPHGRLLKDDVLRYLEQNNGKAVAAAPTALTADRRRRPAASPDAKRTALPRASAAWRHHRRQTRDPPTRYPRSRGARVR